MTCMTAGPRFYCGPAIRALFRQLVADFGGVEATAAYLGCAKGTVSKEMSGGMHLPTEHWAALEDAVGRAPITELMHARLTAVDHAAAIDRMAAVTVAENGDVATAVVRHLSGGDIEDLAKELREAIAASRALLAAIDARAETGCVE